MSRLASPSLLCKHEGHKVLLVEGNTDCHVVMALCEIHKVENDLFGLYDCGSDSLALGRFNALLDAPNGNRPTVLGLLLDADQQGVESRWQSIQQKLRGRPYTLPDKPDPNGTVLAAAKPGYPRIGFWLMPNNRDQGMLEDFIGEMLPAAQVAIVEQCLTLARDAGATTYNLVTQQAKAVVHTYLAWQAEPGRPLGQSITARVLQPITPTAHRFTEWLTQLFSAAA